MVILIESLLAASWQRPRNQDNGSSHEIVVATDVLDQLINVLTPQPEGDGNFSCSNMHPQAFRVYGGQVLAQAVSAAAATVEPDRQLHSQHAYFLRPGNPALPITLEVEEARNGFSFSSRRVVAQQRGKTIFVSSLSFQQPSEGEVYQPPQSLHVPPAESLVSERELALAKDKLDESFMIVTGTDLDIRPVEPVDWDNPVPRSPHLEVWMKTNGPLPDQPGLHQAMLAYMSDAYLLDVCLIAHGQNYSNPHLQIASLDHALWYHEDFRADQWLLHTVEAECMSGGRGLARGRFYTPEGKLVASTMQQGLMRFR